MLSTHPPGAFRVEAGRWGQRNHRRPWKRLAIYRAIA
jgi:hypothetical protein